ncbi:MAG: lysine--tRNA ligase [Minisyncoccia bacterium]
MASIEEIQEARLGKLQLLKDKGINPYPIVSHQDFTNLVAVEDFDSISSSGKSIFMVGRILSLRAQGKIIFITFDDGTSKFQALLKSGEPLPEETFDLFEQAFDIGDFVEIKGTLFKTKRDEKTILAEDVQMLSKSLRPLPEKWSGLQDPEERFRKRYLDIISNPELRAVFQRKAKFWNTIREYMLSKNFLEVETPVLENTTGGAEARPFITHHNALDIDVYLRISAGELWQKKLLVAGFPRTFEIGRIFRNEGISNEHLQDYTQLEYYMAYADYEEGMKMTKELYRLIADKVFGTTKFTIRGMEVDLAKEWEVYDFCTVIKEKFDINPLNTTEQEVLAVLDKNNIEREKDTNIERGIDLLWKSLRKTIAGPGFLIGVPVSMEPLAKKNRNNSNTVERFQVILAGSEMGKGFSELNDPVDQKERFMNQQAKRDAGDDEAQMADMEYVEALEYAMPPAFGFGLSERLFSFLMDMSVRETQLFPLMRPKNKGNSEIDK